MSHIARTLTAVVFMLSLVCLTMPGPAGATACTHVYVTEHVSVEQAYQLKYEANQNGNQSSYNAKNQEFYEYESVNSPGCQGTDITHRGYGTGPGGGPMPRSGRDSAPNLRITGGGGGGSTGSGQTGGSSTHQTTGSGSTSGGPKTKRPTTQTAPSSSGTLK